MLPAAAKLGTFVNETIGGFLVSGTIYNQKVCLFSPDSCLFVRIHSVTEVYADAWLYNKDATYGIIGMGPDSPYVR